MNVREHQVGSVRELRVSQQLVEGLLDVDQVARQQPDVARVRRGYLGGVVADVHHHAVLPGLTRGRLGGEVLYEGAVALVDLARAGERYLAFPGEPHSAPAALHQPDPELVLKGVYSLAEALMPERFTNAFGATCPMESIGLDNGPFYTEFYSVGSTARHVLIDPKVLNSTDLVYVWGCNPIENQMRFAQSLVAARDHGARIVDIGLIFDGTAGFADEFYGIRPATDGDLAIGMINYILQNDLQDSAYLIKRSVAAYMVDDETGLLARDAEGNYLVYDRDARSMAAVAPKGGALPGENLALTGSFEYAGKKVTPVFQLLKDQAARYPLEAVSEKCGLPVEVGGQAVAERAHLAGPPQGGPAIYVDRLR